MRAVLFGRRELADWQPPVECSEGMHALSRRLADGASVKVVQCLCMAEWAIERQVSDRPAIEQLIEILRPSFDEHPEHEFVAI